VSNPQQNGEFSGASPDGDNGDDTPDLQTIAARLDAHTKFMENLKDELEDVREERDALRNEVEDLRQENEDLRQEIENLDARTDLLRLVQNSDDMPAKQRQAALIQNLKEAAERERDRSRDPKASLTPDQAEAALGHPYEDESHVYRDMKRAAEILGDEDVLWYENAGYGKTRLKIDLTKGTVPGAITGRN